MSVTGSQLQLQVTSSAYRGVSSITPTSANSQSNEMLIMISIVSGSLVVVIVFLIIVYMLLRCKKRRAPRLNSEATANRWVHSRSQSVDMSADLPGGSRLSHNGDRTGHGQKPEDTMSSYVYRKVVGPEASKEREKLEKFLGKAKRKIPHSYLQVFDSSPPPPGQRLDWPKGARHSRSVPQGLYRDDIKATARIRYSKQRGGSVDFLHESPRSRSWFRGASSLASLVKQARDRDCVGGQVFDRVRKFDSENLRKEYRSERELKSHSMGSIQSNRTTDSGYEIPINAVHVSSGDVYEVKGEDTNSAHLDGTGRSRDITNNVFQKSSSCSSICTKTRDYNEPFFARHHSEGGLTESVAEGYENIDNLPPLPPSACRLLEISKQFKQEGARVRDNTVNKADRYVNVNGLEALPPPLAADEIESVNAVTKIIKQSSMTDSVTVTDGYENIEELAQAITLPTAGDVKGGTADFRKNPEYEKIQLQNTMYRQYERAGYTYVEGIGVIRDFHQHDGQSSVVNANDSVTEAYAKIDDLRLPFPPPTNENGEIVDEHPGNDAGYHKIPESDAARNLYRLDETEERDSNYTYVRGQVRVRDLREQRTNTNYPHHKRSNGFGSGEKLHELAMRDSATEGYENIEDFIRLPLPLPVEERMRDSVRTVYENIEDSEQLSLHGGDNPEYEKILEEETVDDSYWYVNNQPEWLPRGRNERRSDVDQFYEHMSLRKAHTDSKVAGIHESASGDAGYADILRDRNVSQMPSNRRRPPPPPVVPRRTRKLRSCSAESEKPSTYMGMYLSSRPMPSVQHGRAEDLDKNNQSKELQELDTPSKKREMPPPVIPKKPKLYRSTISNQSKHNMPIVDPVLPATPQKEHGSSESDHEEVPGYLTLIDEVSDVEEEKESQPL